jgi:hypothetical protein
VSAVLSDCPGCDHIGLAEVASRQTAGTTRDYPTDSMAMLSPDRLQRDITTTSDYWPLLIARLCHSSCCAGTRPVTSSLDGYGSG